MTEVQKHNGFTTVTILLKYSSFFLFEQPEKIFISSTFIENVL